MYVCCVYTEGVSCGVCSDMVYVHVRGVVHMCDAYAHVCHWHVMDAWWWIHRDM